MKVKNLILTLGGALLLAALPARAQTPQTFSFQGNVFQTYTVPAAGWFLLDASGAQGGPAVQWRPSGPSTANLRPPEKYGPEKVLLAILNLP